MFIDRVKSGKTECYLALGHHIVRTERSEAIAITSLFLSSYSANKLILTVSFFLRLFCWVQCVVTFLAYKWWKVLVEFILTTIWGRSSVSPRRSSWPFHNTEISRYRTNFFIMSIAHFTVPWWVIRPLNRSEARVDFVMIQTMLLLKCNLFC